MVDTYYGDAYKMSDMNDSKKDFGAPLRVDIVEPDEEEEFSWRKVLFEFSQSTTLSGVNKITESTPFRLRRLVWAILVVCGITAFVYQVILSVVYYYSWPVSVNVRVNYNSTISFPAVTICNQNAFRISKSVEHGVYEELTEAFSTRGLANIQNKTALSMLMTDLYNKTSHTLEDMVLSCTWDTKPCKASALTQRITDHGYCVTFNGNQQSDPDHVVYRRGSSGGLSLKLNIEQYEYMSGPQQGAGIQMLMHDSGSMPEVASLGQMFPPGIQASIGLSIKKIINLEKPYGVCVSDRKLDYYPEYSLGACKTEGLQKFLRQKCGCRDPYMADDGSTPVCTLEQYVTCLKPSIDTFIADSSSGTCEVPCLETHYEPTVSYGWLSRFDLEKMLPTRGNDTRNSVGRYHHALEVRQRFDEDIVAHDQEQLTFLIEAIDNVDEKLKEVSEKVAYVSSIALGFADRVYDRLNTIREGPLRLQQYIMQYNYARGYVLIQERRLNYITNNPYHFLYVFEQSMKTLMSNTTKAFVKDSVYHALITDIKVRRRFATIAKNNVTKIFDGYQNGTQLNTYRFSSVPRYDTIFNASCVAPLPESEHKYIERIITELGRLETVLIEMTTLSAGVVNGTNVSEYELRTFMKRYKAYMNRLNSDIYKLDTRVVNRPLEVAKESVRQFEALSRSLRESRDDFLVVRNKLMHLTETIDPIHIFHMQDLRKIVRNYLKDRTETKLKMALYAGADVQDSVNVMGRILWSIPLFFQAFAAKYGELVGIAKRAYEHIFKETCLWDLLKLMDNDIRALDTDGKLDPSTVKAFSTLLDTSNITNIQRLSADQLRELMNVDLLKMNYDTIVTATQNMGKDIGRISQWFISSEETSATLRERYRKFDTEMASYVKLSRIDHDFLKDNILKMSIYMRELSYSETEQHVAYDMTQLWSDVGGSMGLFIGASALTVFEIVDFLIHSFFVWRKVRAKKSRRPRRRGVLAGEGPVKS